MVELGGLGGDVSGLGRGWWVEEELGLAISGSFGLGWVGGWGMFGG